MSGCDHQGFAVKGKSFIYGQVNQKTIRAKLNV